SSSWWVRSDTVTRSNCRRLLTYHIPPRTTLSAIAASASPVASPRPPASMNSLMATAWSGTAIQARMPRRPDTNTPRRSAARAALHRIRRPSQRDPLPLAAGQVQPAELAGEWGVEAMRQLGDDVVCSGTDHGPLQRVVIIRATPEQDVVARAEGIADVVLQD